MPRLRQFNLFHFSHGLPQSPEAQSTACNSPTSARVVVQVENTSGPDDRYVEG
jgi:hypothetical protein